MLEEFLRIYGERVIHVVIDELNSVLDSILSGNSTTTSVSNTRSTIYNKSTMLNPTSGETSDAGGGLKSTVPITKTSFPSTNTNHATAIKATNDTIESNETTTTMKLVHESTTTVKELGSQSSADVTTSSSLNKQSSNPTTLQATTITSLTNFSLAANNGSITNSSVPISDEELNEWNYVLEDEAKARFPRSLQSTTAPSQKQLLAVEFAKRFDIVHMLKKVVLNMTDAFVPYLKQVGLKESLVAPMISGVLDLGDNLLHTVPKILPKVVHELNHMNVSKLRSRSPVDIVTDIGLKAVLPVVLPNVQVMLSFIFEIKA